MEYDSEHKLAFVTNGDSNSLDILDLSKVKNGQFELKSRVMLEDMDFGGGFKVDGPTSVAVHPGNEFVAVAIVNDTKTDNGIVALFDMDGKYIKKYDVGALPDMVTFTHDGSKILVANEGEPNDDYDVDPEGSVSIIDVSNGPENGTVTTADFHSFNKSELDDSVRVFGPGASVSQDFEPEYITVSDDNKTAYVSLQENNAIAELDLDQKKFTSVNGLGFKDHSFPNNGLDASKDSDSIDIKPLPVLGMYQPDAIASYQVNGKTYLITPNEGDSRDYDGYSEETRVGDLEKETGKKINLNADNYAGFTQDQIDQMVADGLFDDEQLGTLHVTTANGLNDKDEYDALYSFGARSFSIYQADQLKQVYDSGDDFEQIIAKNLPDHFNANNDENDPKKRSDDKGPEPETAVVGKIKGKTYAFIGLEREGGIMVYNIDNPEKPYFVNYFTSRDFSAVDGSVKGDSAPEGLTFIPAEESPNGSPMLLAAHEVSGTVAAYNIDSVLGDKRLRGDDRYSTSVAVSKEGWENADTVVIARGDEFADALAGSPLAYKEDAPILLTHSNYLDKSVQDEIKRLGAKHAIILGGSNAVNDYVEYKVKGMGLSVERIKGDTRFGTATNIAARLDGSPEKAIVVNGDKFPDALSVAAYAAKNGYPILLTQDDKLPQQTAWALRGIGQTIVVGGDGVVSDRVKFMLPNATRYSGLNRYETAAKVIQNLDETGNTAYVTTGEDFADALAGSVLAAKQNAAMVLVKPDQIPDDIKKAYVKLGVERLYVLGGSNAVSDDVADELKPEW